MQERVRVEMEVKSLPFSLFLSLSLSHIIKPSAFRRAWHLRGRQKFCVCVCVCLRLCVCVCVCIISYVI
jgi:hypothetical protein